MLLNFTRVILRSSFFNLSLSSSREHININLFYSVNAQYFNLHIVDASPSHLFILHFKNIIHRKTHIFIHLLIKFFSCRRKEYGKKIQMRYKFFRNYFFYTSIATIFLIEAYSSVGSAILAPALTILFWR